MEKQIQLLLEKMNEMKIEFKKQTIALTESVSTTIDEKLKPLVEENLKLRNEVAVSNKKLHHLDREIRKNNIILHGVEEKEKKGSELMELVLNILNNVSKDIGLDEWDKWEISKIRRLGKRDDNKRRPILITLTLAWRKLDLLRNNKNFPPKVYVTDDFAKDVLKIRKELKIKQQEELRNGKIAILRYDKLIVKDQHNNNKGNEKRKRLPTKSPTRRENAEGSSLEAPQKINKTAILGSATFMHRARSNSSPETAKQ